MQSDLAKTRTWVLEFAPASARDVDQQKGSSGSDDTQAQVRLTLDSREDAQAYASEHGIDAQFYEPKRRKPIIRQGGYGENFATSRRGAWTH